MIKVLKIIKWILIGLVAVLFIGVIVEQNLEYCLEQKRPGSNEFSQLGKDNIHFVKKGAGGPTIVFQSGLGGDYKIWSQIQDSLSHFATTISYDRAGLMWSSRETNPKTLTSISKELIQLLESTNCPKPYIFVGHSLAGITGRPFIVENAKDIAGVVFVDVAHPLQIERSSEELKKVIVAPPEWLVSFVVNTGILRTYHSFMPFIGELPKEHWMNKHIRDYFYTSYKTLLSEAAGDKQMFIETKKYKSFGKIPLTVISSGYPDSASFIGNPKLANEYISIHRDQQKDLLNLSEKSNQVIARKSGHYVPLQEPNIVIDAVLKFIEK